MGIVINAEGMYRIINGNKYPIEYIIEEDKMKFEEEFPGLSRKVTEKEPIAPPGWTLNDCYNEWVKAVQKHCLDKERVREAIVKYKNLIYETEGSDYCYNDLLKELGL